MTYFSDFDIQIQSDELSDAECYEIKGQISFEDLEKENLKNSEN